jgi:hypothetical protein
VREFASAAGYEAHIEVNPRRKAAEPPPDYGSLKRVYPARRANDLMVDPASKPPHPLGEEGWELAGARSTCLRPHLVQPGGFRIESYTAEDSREPTTTAIPQRPTPK